MHPQDDTAQTASSGISPDTDHPAYDRLRVLSTMGLTVSGVFMMCAMGVDERADGNLSMLTYASQGGLLSSLACFTLGAYEGKKSDLTARLLMGSTGLSLVTCAFAVSAMVVNKPDTAEIQAVPEAETVIRTSDDGMVEDFCLEMAGEMPEVTIPCPH